MDRVIYHIDCNGFYASVECLDNPSLKEVPMAVAGDPKNRSGIILAKNEKAKKYGIKTAETVWQARKKCPSLVLVPPHRDRYSEVSKQVKALFCDYTDQVESFGLDEAWLDVTGSLAYFKSSPVQLANRIREQVKNDIGITVSVGISFNKIFAKLGSDMKKPDATTSITRGNYQQLVWSLPASELLFVGKVATDELHRHYINTIGDIARSERVVLNQLLGKGGDVLWLYANGMDEEPVRRYDDLEQVKSIGNGMTFRRDLVGVDEIKAGIISLSDEVAYRLREARLKCGTIQIMIKTPKLTNISRQKQITTPTYLQKEIVHTAIELIESNWRMSDPIRALTVTAMNLVDENDVCQQISLFDMDDHRHTKERYEKIEDAMSKIRKKHGKSSIGMGYVHSEELGIN
ncbi:MAG: DNA polymerase IV [Clostridiales bacterium]|nr:DNA polymerase IV [Clostridiales bacterium]